MHKKSVALLKNRAPAPPAAATGTIGRVGYMMQKDLWLPWRTVIDNMILGM
jgi:ABC-type nitrate/sulfonate/bicarbonate transport system ATPase subunit